MSAVTLKYSGRVVAYQRLKTIEKFKSPVLKVVMDVCESQSLTRGLDYSDLTGSNLVFWKSGRLQEVAHGG